MTRRTTIGWLLSFARAASLRLLVSTVSRLLGHALGAAVLAVPAWGIGMLAAGRADRPSFLAGVVVATLVAAVLRALLRYLEQLLGHLAAFSLMGEMRIQLLERLAPQAPAVTEGLGAARIQTVAVRDVDRVEVFFAHTIAPAVSAVVIPFGATIAAWIAAGATIGATVASVLALGILLPLLGAAAGQRAAQATATVRADIAQHVADTMRTREEIVAAQAEPQRAASLAALDRSLARVLRAAGARAGWRHALSNLRVWGGSLAVLVAGVLASGDADAFRDTLPGLFVAIALVLGTLTSLETVERLATSLPAGLEAARRIRELMCRPPTVTEPESPVTGDRAQSVALEFDNVTYTYPGTAGPVLCDVALEVRRGEFVGVVGATGSGKSTLARLAQRHRDPDVGNVRIDGEDARVRGTRDVTRRVSVASQDPFVLDDAVAVNLRLADINATDSQLHRALALVELDDLDLGAVVGRRGFRLSGGQRQRLALARTLLHAAPNLPGGVLILDEATSHQDPLTQARLIRRLRTLGSSMLVIAHRLETLRDADRVIVLEEGRVVETGVWDELVAADGSFAALLAGQGRNLDSEHH